jgi:hypothetical protein
MDPDALAHNRQLLQELLLPEVDRIRSILKQRDIRLSRAQAKLLQACQGMYSSILQASVALGYRKDIALAQVEQAMALKYFLRRYLPEIDPDLLPKIEECFEMEQKNIYAQIVEMEPQAGFESSGVGYLIKREAISSSGDALKVSLLFASPEHRTGQRMQVFDENKKALGTLNFKKSHGPFRQYEGDLPLAAFTLPFHRRMHIEYAVQTRFNPRWKNRQVDLFLLPHFRPGRDEDFFLDATFGPQPGISRQKFLSSLGLFGK